MAWNHFGRKKKVNKDITEKNEEYKEGAENVQKHNNSVTGIIAGGNRSPKGTTRGTSQHAVPQITEIRNLTKKSTELLEIAEIIGIKHQSDKHSNASIDGLREQINAVKATGRELNRSLKALTDLPSNIAQEQANFRTEVNRPLSKLTNERKLM